MNNADVNMNKITDLINVNMEKEFENFNHNDNLQSEQYAIGGKIDLRIAKDTKESINTLTFQAISKIIEEMFTKEEKAELDKRFLLFSSDGVSHNNLI